MNSVSRILVKKFGSIIITTLKYYSIYHVTTNYLIPVELVICKGSSMEPTLFNNDILLTEKLSVRRQKIRRDDLVICKHPNVSNKTICKRIYETYYDLYNNHEDNDDKNISDNSYNPNYVIPRGYVRLIGDNKRDSIDSDTYGNIPYGLLESRVFLRIWPFKFFEKA